MGASVEFEEFRRRVRAERSVRAQRDAAERRVPGERLRRAIREAFASKRARELAEDREVGVKPNPLEPPDSQR
jgi:hypothetical protein